jgi:Choline/ethanolamine kinase
MQGAKRQAGMGHTSSCFDISISSEPLHSSQGHARATSTLSTMVGCLTGCHACLQTLLPRSSSAEWVAAPTKAIKLIDYEYSGVNAVAYDIANHWCGLFGMFWPAFIRRRGEGLGSGSGPRLGLTRARRPASGLAAVSDVCKHGRCTVRPCAAALRRRQQPKPSVTLIFCRCEYAADYDTATPHVLDFSKMPSPARQVTAQRVLTGAPPYLLLGRSCTTAPFTLHRLR